MTPPPLRITRPALIAITAAGIVSRAPIRKGQSCPRPENSAPAIIGPLFAGALFSGIGHDWPFLVGAALTIPAAIIAINAGRALKRGQAPAVVPAE